jgi:hypothetical protein
MHPTRVTLCLIVVFLLTPAISIQAQDTVAHLSGNYLATVQAKARTIAGKMQHTNQVLLEKMQKQELKLHRRLVKKDSAKARQVFSGISIQYEGLLKESRTPNGKSTPYLSSIDTLSTTLSFLKNQQLGVQQAGQLAKAQASVDQMTAQIAHSERITAFIKERQQQLKSDLSKCNLGKQLTGVNKEVYYYQQKVQEYKALIRNKEEMEAKMLSALRNVPAFRSFMQQNSYLSRLFPAGSGSSPGAGLAGLQTRAQVQQMISQQLGAISTAGVVAGNPLEGQLQEAQGQMNQLKDKVNQLGGGNSDMAMPDGFKPNSQKTKSLLQRLEYGFNLQSQKSNNMLPSISDIALTLGYKVDDRSTVGLGASYKLGWGKPFNEIRLSSEGVGLRSFIDLKAKGSIWITGGYELNYLQAFSKLDDLHHLNVWQKSGLAGLTRKYKIGRRKGNLQLLWDFLSYSQVPKAPAFKFRAGYSL